MKLDNNAYNNIHCNVTNLFCSNNGIPSGASWHTGIVGGLCIGAALSLLIPDPTICKAVAIVLGLSIGIIAYVNAANRGIIARFNYNPWNIVQLTGLWSQ